MAEENLTVETPDVIETEESVLVEKDGELFVKVSDEGQKEPVEEPANPEGKTQDGENQEPSEEEKKASEKEKPSLDVDEDLLKKYEGKSKEDLIKMHVNATKEKDRLGTELGKLRSQTSTSADEMTTEELIQSLSANDMKAAYIQEKTKLSLMDAVLDEEQYNAQAALVNQLELDYLEKRQDELFRDQLNSQSNKQFQDQFRGTLKDMGIDVPDAEFSELTEIAKGYLENGKYTGTSYHKAMIDKYGVEKYQKFFSMAGEEKARKDISEATRKAKEKVDVSGSGKNAKLVNLNDLPEREIIRIVDQMSPHERDLFYKRLNQ